MSESKRISLLSRRDLFIVCCMMGFVFSFFFVATQTETGSITLSPCVASSSGGGVDKREPPAQLFYRQQFTPLSFGSLKYKRLNVFCRDEQVSPPRKVRNT